MVVGYYSYKFNAPERNYTIMEKEAFSIIRALEHFRTIVFAAYIEIFTDNANVLFEKQLESKRVLRWKFLLSEFDYKLSHIKGSDNSIADYLSRIYAVSPSKNEFYDINQISTWQKTDQVAQEKIKRKELFKLHNSSPEILVDITGKLYIPEKNISLFLQQVHEYLGHPGVSKMSTSLINNISSPYLSIKIKNFVQACKFCQYNKIKNIEYGHSKKFFFEKTYLKTVVTDIVCPFNSELWDCQFKDKFYLLTFLDVSSRWLQVYPISNISSQSVVSKFSKFITKYGAPQRILSDNGTQ